MENKINLAFSNTERIKSYDFTESVDRGKVYVNYGADNQFPNKIWELYINNSYHQSIVDGIVEYVVGKGVKTTLKISNLEDVFQKAVFDYYLFGGFAIQVIRSRAGEIVELHNLDFMKLRVDEELQYCYYAKSWGKYQSLAKVKKYEIINDSNKSGVYYFKGLKTRGCYPIPSYIGSLQALETQIEIQNFHLSSIKNNFAVSAIINFNNGIPDEDTIKQIERKIEDKFTGSESAAKFLLNFNEDKEKATTIERLESDNFDEKFTQLAKDTRNNIFAAHRVTSPCLFGVMPEGTGFSKTEYSEAFDIFNQTVILRIQKEICKQFDNLFSKENVITVTPFAIESDESKEIQNKESEVTNE